MEYPKNGQKLEMRKMVKSPFQEHGIWKSRTLAKTQCMLTSLVRNVPVNGGLVQDQVQYLSWIPLVH